MAEHEEYHVMRHEKHPKGAGLHGVYQNKTRAYNVADRLDNEYGAVAHHVKRVPKESTQSHWGNGKGNPEGDTK